MQLLNISDLYSQDLLSTYIVDDDYAIDKALGNYLFNHKLSYELTPYKYFTNAQILKNLEDILK